MKKISLKIGPYKVCSIPTGFFGLDGGAMFGTVPRVLWEKSNPPDNANRIQMEARGLLLKSPQSNILIDVGNGGYFVEKYGEKIGPKFAEMYAISEEGASLEKSLSRFDLKPSDINQVILTHLHFDHAGGSTKPFYDQNNKLVKDENGNPKIVPTFPKAKYYLQKQNLETAQKPNIRERASYFAANFQPLIENNQLELVDGEKENFLPYISAIVSNGHTKGHQAIKISDGTTTVVYCGDVIPTSSHVRLSWIMGYDLEALTIIQEKQKLLKQAAQNSWYLFFEHDPICELCTVNEQGSDFAVKEKFILE